jgi:pyruvate-formate lyase-activating enzyme
VKANVKPTTKRKGDSAQNRYLTAVVANGSGEIFELTGYAAVGRDGPLLLPLKVEETRILPHGGELMYLPDRLPILYNLHNERIEVLSENPHQPGQKILPVAAFNSPGYVLSHVTAYEEGPGAGFLPLFSYGAVGWYRGRFRSAVILVDAEPRQDLRLMPKEKVLTGVRRMRRKLTDNRLRAHLEKCALTYGCPAAKNFFLGRYEAPLPTASTCNARCLGCLSLQDQTGIPPSQDRIAFTPTAREIAEIALAHIEKVPRAVVSFGQGCEGDPLMAAGEIEPAIRWIRGKTEKGTINLNTNAGRPETLKRLITAGLDSLRVSINSLRANCYSAYFRPKGYDYDDVMRSIDLALGQNLHVALNYLNCPGFSDTAQEAEALCRFLEARPVHLIQWRNLNFDPLRYLGIMNEITAHDPPMGMKALLRRIRKAFPALAFGYFNPPREAFHVSGKSHRMAQGNEV